MFEQVMGPVRELDGDALIVQITGKSHFCRRIHNFPWSLGGWEVDGSCVGDISGCVHGVVCDPHVDVVPIPDQVQVPYIHQLKAVLQTMRGHVLQYVSDILCHVGTHWCVKEEMEFHIGWEMRKFINFTVL